MDGACSQTELIFEQELAAALDSAESKLPPNVDWSKLPPNVDSTSADVTAALMLMDGGEPATKKRKREVKEFDGSESEFTEAWVKIKSLFHTHPAIFNEWMSKFMGKLVSLETQVGHDFYTTLRPRQKQVVVDEAVKLEKKLEKLLSKDEDTPKSGEGEKKKGKTYAKKSSIQTIDEEVFKEAWQAMAFMGNPLLSSVEYNFLANLGLRLREHQLKTIMAPYEKDLLRKILDSVPTRVAKEKVIAQS